MTLVQRSYERSHVNSYLCNPFNRPAPAKCARPRPQPDRPRASVRPAYAPAGAGRQPHIGRFARKNFSPDLS